MNTIYMYMRHKTATTIVDSHRMPTCIYNTYKLVLIWACTDRGCACTKQVQGDKFHFLVDKGHFLMQLINTIFKTKVRSLFSQTTILFIFAIVLILIINLFTWKNGIIHDFGRCDTRNTYIYTYIYPAKLAYTITSPLCLQLHMGREQTFFICELIMYVM